jgi:hypothetical protein
MLHNSNCMMALRGLIDLFLLGLVTGVLAAKLIS